MQFLRAACSRPDFPAHLLHRCRTQRSMILRRHRLQPAPHGHGAGAAFLERRAVQEAVHPRIDDLGSQRRGLTDIAAFERNRSRLDVGQHLDQPLDVHRLGQAVVYRLSDQRVIRHLAVTDDVFQTGQLVGKDAGHQVFGLHSQQMRRRLASGMKTSDGERNDGVPAPTNRKHRRIEQSLHEYVPHCGGLQEMLHVLQRKALRSSQRQDQRILVGGGLQLEVEGAAESLPQRQSPGAVHTAAEWRVHDQLHAP